MSEFVRPRVVISRCLGFAACRYDGQMVSFPLARELAEYADITTVCPETSLGLGIPRNPIKLYQCGDRVKLQQPASEADLTDAMRTFADEFLEALLPVDGFILKAKSPSCGFYGTKLFSANDGSSDATTIGITAGLFAQAVHERFPLLPREDEKRLEAAEQRHHFLTQVFTWARFRGAQDTGSVAALLEFQSENKYLLMAYHQIQQKVLGRITAHAAGRPFAEVRADYAQALAKAIQAPPAPVSYVNAVMHCFGYFSDDLGPTEKRNFLDLLTSYRCGQASRQDMLELLRTYVEQFNEDYLRKQTLLQPYPPSLRGKAPS